MVGGGRPFLPEILGQIDSPHQKRRLPIEIRSYSTLAVTSGKNYHEYEVHYTGFPTNLIRGTA